MRIDARDAVAEANVLKFNDRQAPWHVGGIEGMQCSPFYVIEERPQLVKVIALTPNDGFRSSKVIATRISAWVLGACPGLEFERLT